MKEINWIKTEFVILKVYGILPAFFHEMDTVPCSNGRGCSAYSFGPVVLIEPNAWGNLPLIEHELTHVKQWYRSLGRHSNKLKDPKYRVKTELEAMANQIKKEKQLYSNYDTNFNIHWYINQMKENFKIRGVSYDFTNIESSFFKLVEN